MSTSRRAITSLAVAGLLLAGLLYQRSLSESQAPEATSSSPEAPSPEDSSTASQDPTETSGPAEVAEAPSRGRVPSQAEPEETEEDPTDRSDVPEDAAEELPPELRAMVEGGGPYTDEAMEYPVMKELELTDPHYDPVTEARQTFHAFEQTLLAADPLDPVSWKAALAEHQVRNAGVMRRADFLRRSGQEEDARDLMLEWSRLYGIYQARAYGRPTTPLPLPEE